MTSSSILLLLMIACSKIVAQVEVDQVDRKCSPTESCVHVSTCPASANNIKELVVKSKEARDYRKLAETVSKLGCNKKEKAICCQINRRSQENLEGKMLTVSQKILRLTFSGCTWKRKSYRQGQLIRSLLSWGFQLRCGQGRRFLRPQLWGQLTYFK